MFAKAAFSLFILLCISTYGMGLSLAATTEGVVQGSGSHLNYRVIIKETTGGFKTLCPGEVSDSINNYHRLTAKVEYEVDASKKSCVKPKSFVLLKTPSGTEPIIGLLSKAADHYSVSANNNTYYLEKPPSKLKAMVDKKVVLDVAKSDTPNPKGTSKTFYNVLFFAPAP